MPVTLKLAGTGSGLAALKALASNLDVESEVEFAGSIDDVPGFLRTLDLFVFPSDGPEGMPISILEAMACGLPVVATRRGGIPEIVDDGRTGVLCEPGSPEKLANALTVVLSDREKAAAMGREARHAVVSDFSYETYSQALEDVYESTVGVSG